LNSTSRNVNTLGLSCQAHIADEIGATNITPVDLSLLLVVGPFRIQGLPTVLWWSLDAKFEKGLLLVLRARKLQEGDATWYMLRSITFHHISMAVGSGWVLSRVGRYTDMWGPLKSKLNLHRQTALPLQRQLGVLSWGGFVGGTGSAGATMA
jgi:hypothetical protein